MVHDLFCVSSRCVVLKKTVMPSEKASDGGERGLA